MSSVTTIIFVAIIFELFTVSISAVLPVSEAKTITSKRKPNEDDTMKAMDEFFKMYGPSFKKMKETGGLIPNLSKKRKKGSLDKAIANNEVGVDKKKKRFRKKNKSTTGTGGPTRRHIGKVPKWDTFHFGDPPSGLLDDQNKSAEYYDESIESQKEAFEAILNEHAKHRKRPRKLHHERHIKLKYDYQNRKYTITETSDE